MSTYDPSRLSSLVLSYIRQHPIIFTSAVAIVPLAALAMSSYRGYIDLGPGGLPHNAFGWLLQEALRPLSLSSTTDLGVFQNTGVSAPYEPHGNTRFLREPLAQRRGDRPVIPNYVAPQRQATEKGDAALVTRMNNHLRDLSSRHPDKLAVKASGLEAKENHGEASSHMVLSLTDAKEALAKGWAELHPLSGVMGRIPLPYVMIYAPRDEEEFEQWARFVDAAVAFTSAGKQ